MSNKYLDIAMEKVIKQEVNAVLDKISIEVEQEADYQDAYVNADVAKGMLLALSIIDKYRNKMR